MFRSRGKSLVVPFDCVNKLYDRKWPTCKSIIGRAGLPSFPSFFPKPKKGGKEESLDPSIAFLCKLNKESSSKCVRQLNDWLTHRGSCVKRDLKVQNLLHDT